MKKILKFFICLMLFSTFMHAVAVAAETPTIIKVGVYNNPPKIYTDEKGTVSGFWPILIRYIAAEEGWKIDWVSGSWAQGLKRLEIGDIDIMPDTGWTEPRSRKFAFSKETVLVSWSRLYVPGGSNIESIIDLDGKTVAALKGSFNLEGPEGIKEIAHKFDIKVTFKEMESYARVFEALERGDIDAGVTNKDFGNQHEGDYNIERTAIIFQPARMQFAVSKNAEHTSLLVNRIDTQIKKLKEDKNTIYHQAFSKYIGGKRAETHIEVFPVWVKRALVIGSVIIIFLFIVGIIFRIQIRRRTSELRSSESNLRILFEAANNVAFIKTDVRDKEPIITEFSPGAEKIFGYGREEVLEKPFSILYLKEVVERFPELLKTLRETKESLSEETIFVRKNGDRFPAMATTHPVFDKNGEITATIGVFVDITARKLADDKNIESKKMLMTILDSIPAEVYVADMETYEILYMNEQMKKSFGADLTGQTCWKVFQKAATGPCLTCTNSSLLDENNQPTGVKVWEDLNSLSRKYYINHDRAIRWNDEKYVRIQIAIDITERKRAEERLHDSETKMRSIFRVAPTGIGMVKNRVLYDVNPRICEMIGYAKEELIGRNSRILYPSQEEFDLVGREKYRQIEIHDTGIVETRWQKKDGSILDILLASTPIDIDDHSKGVTFTALDITDRKQAEKAIIQERDFVTAILRWIESIVMVINPDGYVVTFNKAAEKCSGYTLEEIRHKPFWETLVPPRERNLVREVIDNVKTNALSNENKNFWLAKDGQERLIHWYNSVLTGSDGAIEFILCTGLDLTERSQAEDALQRSEEHYQAVLENMQEGYFEIDLAGNFLSVNKSITETLGYPKSELMGMNNRTFMDEKNAKKVFKIYNNAFITNQPQKYLLSEIIRKDGEKRIVEISTSLRYGPNGEPIGFFGISRDVTDRKRMDEMMIQTEKMMSVGGLAAGMAHELNNPLGGILQGVQNVQRRLSPDLKSNHAAAEEFGIDLQTLQLYLEKREIFPFLKGMMDSGKKASHIISSMLQFSRRSEAQMAPVDLAELMGKALNLAEKDYDLKKKYDFRDINIVEEFDSDFPLVPCNETEIEQVMLNLLNNAAQAMKEKGQVDSPCIIIRLQLAGSMARIEIQDNGPGMVEEIKKRIFEPFFTTKPVGEGTGLGLSVSYMIITNNHKGTLEVVSEIGKGTKFIIQLPLKSE